jgi:hypothetical protein
MHNLARGRPLFSAQSQYMEKQPKEIFQPQMTKPCADVRYPGSLVGNVRVAAEVARRAGRALPMLYEIRHLRSHGFILVGNGHATVWRAGRRYVDVGTLHGYREALRVLENETTGFPESISSSWENLHHHEFRVARR